MNTCSTEIVYEDHRVFGGEHVFLCLALAVKTSVKEMLNYLARKTKKKSVNSSL